MLICLKEETNVHKINTSHKGQKMEKHYTNNLHSSVVNLFTISIASTNLLSVSFHCQLELLKLYFVDVTSDNSNH
jgi:hypothetical protein